MTGIFKKISAAARNTTTYRIGLLQAKTYRVLKQHTAKALEPLGISTIEWAFLGLLTETPSGIRAAVAAQELGVEAPFISALLKNLEKKQLIESGADKTDSRAKLLHLTKKGEAFVQSTEQHLRSAMRPLVAGISLSDLLAYITVLEAISKNREKK